MTPRLFCTAILMLFAATLHAEDTEPPSITYGPKRTSKKWVESRGVLVAVDKGISWKGKTAYLSLTYDLVLVDAQTGKTVWSARVGAFWNKMTFNKVTKTDGRKVWAVELRPGNSARGVQYHDLATGKRIAVASQKPVGKAIKAIKAWSGSGSNNKQPIRRLVTSQAEWDKLRKRMFGGRTANKTPAFSQIDFTKQVVLVISDGITSNCRGISLRSGYASKTRLLLRLRHHYYQSMGKSRPEWPYGVFVLSRQPGKKYVVQRNTQRYIGGPPIWKTFYETALKPNKK